MFLKYISNQHFDEFIKSLICSNTNTIIVRAEDNQFVNIFTNSIIGTFHITNFDCVNVETGKIYSNVWRKFMIQELDKFNPSQTLSNQYIDGLHELLEEDTIYGPAL